MEEAGTSKKARADVIVISSGKGGVGKTTSTAAIGTALAMLGKRTLVVDLDIGLRNLDIMLGLENRIVYNIVDVAKEVCKPSQALIRSKKSPNLFLLPASQTDDKDVLSEEEIRKVVGGLAKEFHYVLVDSPAGIEQGFRNAVAAANKAIIVSTPEVPAIRDADRVIGKIHARGIEPNLIVNRLNPGMVRRGSMLSVNDVEEILGIPLIGVVPDDRESVNDATNLGESLIFDRTSKAGKEFQLIARRIVGEVVDIERFSTPKFWARIARSLGVS